MRLLSPFELVARHGIDIIAVLCVLTILFVAQLAYLLGADVTVLSQHPAEPIGPIDPIAMRLLGIPGF